MFSDYTFNRLRNTGPFYQSSVTNSCLTEDQNNFHFINRIQSEFECTTDTLAKVLQTGDLFIYNN